MKRTDEEDREPGSELPAHFGGIATGIIGFAIRMVLLFAVMGAGYTVYTWLGTKWFHVFVFATIAAMLHFELLRIDRHFDAQEDLPKEEDPPNPFRKR